MITQDGCISKTFYETNRVPQHIEVKVVMSRRVNSSKPGHRSVFQLPSLPPWHTPKFKLGNHNNNTTPLKRPTRTIRSPGVRIASSNVIHIPKRNEGRVKKPAVIPLSEYDYTPFYNKLSVRDSQIKSLIECERAAHCLVFHRDKHKSNLDQSDYRPDVDIFCGDDTDTDKQSQDQHSIDYNMEDKPPNDENNLSLLQTLPGFSRRELNTDLRKKNTDSRIDILQLDKQYSKEIAALTKFWSKDSLVYSLRPEEIHSLYEILQSDNAITDQEMTDRHDENDSRLAGHTLSGDFNNHTQEIRNIMKSIEL